MGGSEEAVAGDAEAAVVELSASVRSLTAAGDNRAAALACARLGEVFQTMLGNRLAARPWFARAVRLVADEEPCVEQGWVAVAPMGCDVDDPAELLARADLALDRARRFGDTDLEVKALADGGLARVQAGQVAEGMAMIDESMALACGSADGDTDVLAKSACSFYTACYYTADFQRVESWSPLFRRRGMIGPAPGGQAILSSHCESVQATLLCHLGRWSEAEAILLRAYAAIEQAMPGSAWYPPVILAELRILQGRLDEAEALLLGRDHFMSALLPTARLYLARGEFDLAAAAARRGLRMVAADRVRAATLLGVLVDSELGRGDVTAATEACLDLERRVQGLDLPTLTADAARLRARVEAVRGDGAAAVETLRVGLVELGGAELPVTRMALHLELARVLEASDRPAAVIEARAAAALLGELDVVLAPADAGVLERLAATVPAAAPPAGCRLATLSSDGAWWTASCGGTSVRLRDTKGLRYLADLVAHPGVERHALDLVTLVEGTAPDGADRRHLRDAGTVSDGRARDAYRRRLVELRDGIEDALATGDDARAARIQVELDEVVAELGRAFGLGGRGRPAGSAAEKARLNTTRALRAAVAKVAESLPEAGAVLDRRLRTGTFCSYAPHPDDDVTWSVQP